MNLRLGNGINPLVVEALFDILDEEFDGEIKKRMKGTTIYVVTSQKDGIIEEIVLKLKDKEMDQFIKIFTEREYKDKEIVFCISDQNDMMESIIAKINVENGNGYKTISAVHFVERILRIFQSKNIIGTLSQQNEAILVDKIIYGIPGIVRNSEVVDMQPERKKNVDISSNHLYI
jgi:hypothetical protein